MLKDHLGNVRMVLTQEQQTDAYPVASLETTPLANEKLYYAGLDTGRVNKSGVSGYPNDTYSNPNDFIQKLNGNGAKIGASMVLKVMAGDKFNLRVNSWWKSINTPGTPVNPLNDLLSALAGSIGAISGAHGGATATEITSSGVLSPNATNFLNSQSGYTTSKPKAFVNWVLFDEQFKYVSSNSGFEQAGASNIFTTHTRTGITLDKSGYLYVYVSNETPNIDVFFDNLQVTHVRGALLETNEYYPFGLLMKNISYRSLKGKDYPENKKQYNGIDKENDLGIEVYDAQFRELDAQVGRWWQIDPATENMEMWSPYVSNYDNPITYMDPLGDEPEDGDGCCKGLLNAIVQTGKDIITFSVSAGNALATNQWGGAGRGDPSSYSNPHDAAVSRIGQTFGDLLTVGGSVVATAFSVVVEGGTIGFATPAVVPLLTQQWAVATPTAIKNIANDLLGNKANASSNSSSGRNGKQQKLREIANDPKAGKSDKGWIKQEQNSIKTGNRKSIRVPPGKNLAHDRGKEARKGNSYKNSKLQDIDLHKTQHRVERKVKRNNNE